MIPSFITKANILEAVQRIGQGGVPKRRRSRNYCLLRDGLLFPPKYTIALAHKIATGLPRYEQSQSALILITFEFGNFIEPEF